MIVLCSGSIMGIVCKWIYKSAAHAVLKSDLCATSFPGHCPAFQHLQYEKALFSITSDVMTMHKYGRTHIASYNYCRNERSF